MNKQINCSSLHSFSSNDNRFVKLGSIPNTNHIFECGINNNGNDEINAYINADGTCSFVNSDVVTNFTSLNDVPHNYIEKSNHILIVDENEKCIKFSDKIKIKTLDGENLKMKIIETEKLNVKETFNVQYLQVNKLIQENSNSENIINGLTNFNKVNINELNNKNLNGKTANFSENVIINKELNVGKIITNEITSRGKSNLEIIKCEAINCDLLECNLNANFKSLNVNENLNINGRIKTKCIETTNIINNENLISNDLNSLTGRISKFTSDEIETKTIKTKSDILFGSIEMPKIFLPNQNNNLDIDVEMYDLRGHGYGFAPKQVLDTINLKIKCIDKKLSLSENNIIINYNYYNLKNTIPTVYKLGEVIYQLDDETVMVQIKFNKNIQTAPYWILSIELQPF